MLIFPNINPVALDLGIFQVHWYGLMYLLAFAAAYALATWRAKVRGDWTTDMVSDLVFYGAMGVILGGRIGYVLFYEFSQFVANPLFLFKIQQGGMSFHGGFLGVVLAMVFFARKYKKTAFQTLDFIAPCVPTGLLFGRLGNYINGELFGRVSDGGYSWLMGFHTAQYADQQYLQAHPDQIGLAQQVSQYLMLPRHPSQLYQAFCEGLLLFIVLWWFSSKPRPRMAVSAVFLIGYGIARFAMEFVRQPDADQGFILLGWVTKGQMLSFPMILVGIWMLWYAYRRRIYDWGPNKTV
jgi:phosphatidylglycerol:prolipoprotein diacylglycerol transferase